ncbi:hypothetical protein ACVWZZ_005572 [Bradyrhizobium sp. LM6.10]
MPWLTTPPLNTSKTNSPSTTTSKAAQITCILLWPLMMITLFLLPVMSAAFWCLTSPPQHLAGFEFAAIRLPPLPRDAAYDLQTERWKQDFASP